MNRGVDVLVPAEAMDAAHDREGEASQEPRAYDMPKTSSVPAAAARDVESRELVMPGMA